MQGEIDGEEEEREEFEEKEDDEEEFEGDKEEEEEEREKEGEEDVDGVLGERLFSLDKHTTTLFSGAKTIIFLFAQGSTI